MLDRFDINEVSEEVRTRFYIGGRWVAPRTSQRLRIVSPITERTQFSLPAGSAKDMDDAVLAASDAFENGPWPRLAQNERAKFLRALAGEVEKRIDLFQRVWTAQVGVVHGFAHPLSAMVPATLHSCADLAETFPFETERTTEEGSALIVHEPVGVCALVVPWNAPLVLLVSKLGSALLAGCTIVAKPSPETPLDALLLAECAEAAGLPEGVFNVVPADREAGDHLIRNPRVDKVSFTGSTVAGRHIASVCADRVARVSLELGGKSAAIVCDDADFSTVLSTLVPFSMPFAGQICFAQTRILVSEARHDEFVEAYRDAIANLKVGDPWDPEVDMGPLATRRQFERVLEYIDIGRREGAKLILGGERASFDKGYFVEPTIFDDVTSGMRIAQEEIFGPVVAIMRYTDEDHAVSIANDSSFGLSGSVFTADVARGARIARKVRTGNISINGLQLDAGIPFGGFKQSGIGREGGPEGIEAFLETKAIYLPQT